MNTNYALGTVLVAEGTKKRKKKVPVLTVLLVHWRKTKQIKRSVMISET